MKYTIDNHEHEYKSDKDGDFCSLCLLGKDVILSFNKHELDNPTQQTIKDNKVENGEVIETDPNKQNYYEKNPKYKETMADKSKKEGWENEFDELFPPGLWREKLIRLNLQAFITNALNQQREGAYTPDELMQIFKESPYSSGHTFQFLKWLKKEFLTKLEGIRCRKEHKGKACFHREDGDIVENIPTEGEGK